MSGSPATARERENWNVTANVPTSIAMHTAAMLVVGATLAMEDLIPEGIRCQVSGFRAVRESGLMPGPALIPDS
jgi:hypothetical protein